MTDTPSLVAVLTAVLQAAEGSLEYGQLMWILGRRFNAVLAPPLSLDADDGLAEKAAGQHDKSSLSGELARAGRIEERIAAVRDQLSEAELSVIGMLDDLARLQATLGLRRSQSYVVRARLVTVLNELLGDELDRGTIMAALIEQARS